MQCIAAFLYHKRVFYCIAQGQGGDQIIISNANSLSFLGLDMRPVKTEAQIIPGIAGFAIIGLCDKAVFESKERIKSAFHSMGISMPMKKIVISLSPSIPKEGSYYDLGIAVSILILVKILPATF